MFLRREFVELGRATTDMIPRSFRTDKEMHLDLDTRITFDASERNPMHLPLVRST